MLRGLSNAAGRAGATVMRLLRAPATGTGSEATTESVHKPGAGPDGGLGSETGAAYGLGAEIAVLGPRARGVFSASGRIREPLDGRTALVVVDDVRLAGRLPPNVAVVSLADLPPSASVPALDPESVNPVGWTPDHEPAADTGRPAAAAGPDRTAAMRRSHHVEDWTADRADAAARAGELAAAAACGAVVSIGGDPELEPLLGSELYGLMTDSARIAAVDGHQREALSIAMRRAALRDHSLRARARQILGAAGLEGPSLPLVSVLVPTRRPDRLPAVIDAVTAQTYPRLELVLGLHGDGFPRARLDEQLSRVACPGRAVRVPAECSLGEVLNEALAASSGEIVAKFDDDDLYGPEHLWDLVLAAEYSGAALVGKTSEYVYLAGSDRTVRRFVGFGERYINPARYTVTGAAMLVSREALESVGGWRPMGVGEDKTLVHDVGAAGGKVYRTHGAGFLAMRHGTGHTWEVDDSYFLEQAQDGRDGCDLRFAGVV